MRLLNRGLKILKNQKRLLTAKTRRKIENGPGLEDFIEKRTKTLIPETGSYFNEKLVSGNGRKVFYETHGCQMNVNDMEVVRSVMNSAGFEIADSKDEASLVLLMTCSIRENAEQKIMRKLHHYKVEKRKRNRENQLTVGILGCMAERLKEKLLDSKFGVDLIAGPDAYRDLPRLVAQTDGGQQAANVILSLEETYADISPVRHDPESVTAFVSVMRGCDNMCTYCIVPFTRGRERSRPIESILDEVRMLSDQGVKQVTLLGQNVNSYRDLSESVHYSLPSSSSPLSPGFKTVYKPKIGGRRFADLLQKVSEIDPEMRIRFTSPHPKDFPDEVLQVISARANICNQLHLPAQSGNDALLEAMGRGYTVTSYLDLVHKIREKLKDVSLTSDFIAGFCGETEQAHQDSLELIRRVKYDFCYCFPYSMREKTRAFHRLKDNIPYEVKARRSQELVDTFRDVSLELHKAQIGQQQLVLVEGLSKRSQSSVAARNDGGTKVIVENGAIASNCDEETVREIKSGDYVMVQITDATSQVLKAQPLFRTKLSDGA